MAKQTPGCFVSRVLSHNKTQGAIFGSVGLPVTGPVDERLRSGRWVDVGYSFVAPTAVLLKPVHDGILRPRWHRLPFNRHPPGHRHTDCIHSSWYRSLGDADAPAKAKYGMNFSMPEGVGVLLHKPPRRVRIACASFLKDQTFPEYALLGSGLPLSLIIIKPKSFVSLP